jgi:hypothetical protein
MRIGIYAIKNIADGEALSYDYQFDTKVSHICHIYHNNWNVYYNYVVIDNICRRPHHFVVVVVLQIAVELWHH